MNIWARNIHVDRFNLFDDILLVVAAHYFSVDPKNQNKPQKYDQNYSQYPKAKDEYYFPDKS